VASRSAGLRLGARSGRDPTPLVGWALSWGSTLLNGRRRSVLSRRCLGPSLLGWYPEARESGTTVSNHRLGYSGNRLGRREVWFWAMQLLTPRQPATPFAAYYQRLRARGVPGHAAVGHLAGKLISVLFFCLRSGRPYDPVQHARALALGDAK
jgi:hypothetical protein